jgi:putative tryptophan/tyrosine transport system substrate-binding protein
MTAPAPGLACRRLAMTRPAGSGRVALFGGFATDLKRPGPAKRKKIAQQSITKPEGRLTMAQNEKPRKTAQFTIGFLHSGSEQNNDHKELIDALIEGAELSGLPKQDFDIKPKYAEDRHETLEQLARELIDQKIKLLVAAGGTASAVAVQKVTATMLDPPDVVFTSVAVPPDPRPKHMTGVCALTSGLDAARLKWLKVLMPDHTEFAVLVNPARPNFNAEWQALETAAKQLGITTKRLDVPSTSQNVKQDVETAFKSFTDGSKVKPLLVTADPLYNNNRKAIAKLANNNKLAAMYQWRQFAEDNGLISFGTKLTQAYRIAGAYVGLILKGGKRPDQLEIQTARTEMIINKKTATQELGGLAIPPLLLAHAEDVIE